MRDFCDEVRSAALAALKAAVPDVPGFRIGDADADPDKLAAAFYVDAAPDGEEDPGRRQLKLTLYARTAVLRDRKAEGVKELAARLTDAVESDAFSADLIPVCDAVVAQGAGWSYEVDDRFHTEKCDFAVFLREK